jgi:2,4-dienoyl-CoA reductase-like NADH-dependent reductase (Old Yellow Enzyme family)
MPDRRSERLLNTTWPTADESRAARWFQPIQFGPVTALTRTWVPAMVPWRASAEGLVTEAVLGWYERFAQGTPGVLVVEATGIRDVPSGPLLRASDDRFVPGLKQLVDTVKRASKGQTRLFIQLIDFLAIKRRPDPARYVAQFLRVTERLRAACGQPWESAPEEALRAHLASLAPAQLDQLLDAREREALHFGVRERVTDVQLPHLAQLPVTLPDLFAQAAERCAEAGFDGVELHYAHAYTMASFLSATNTRADGAGGPREQRVRVPLEVLRRVRAQVGSRLAVGCRMLADEIIEGGSTADDIDFFAQQLAAGGLDFLSLSRGGKFEDARQPKVGQAAYPYTGPSGHECMPTTRIAQGPWGRNRSAVARIRAHLRAAGLATPVVLCGGIATFAQAEQALASNEADVVASARQALADPDWFRKVQAGQGNEVRRCLFTNYCEGLDQSHQPVTCQLWDRLRSQPDDDQVTRVDGRRLVAPPWAKT